MTKRIVGYEITVSNNLDSTGHPTQRTVNSIVYYEDEGKRR